MKRSTAALLAAGAALVLGPASAAAAPGDLDTTFGTGGFATTDFFGANGLDVAEDVALDASGRIVAVGTTFNAATGSYDFGIVRYHSDGQLDRSFSADGRVTTDFGSTLDFGRAVAVQPDGKIVVAGVATPPNGGDDFAVARFRPDGELDPTFSGDGKVTFGFDNGIQPDAATTVAIDGAGVVVGGTSFQGATSYDIAIARLTDDGGFDPQFGGDGRVTAATNATDVPEALHDLVVEPDGRVVTTGSSLTDSTDEALSVFRFNPDGTPDTSFSSDGVQRTEFPEGTSTGFSLARRPDGRIVVAGRVGSGPQTDSVVVRYLPDGDLDRSFSGDGYLVRSFASGPDSVAGVAVQHDGKVIVGGSGVGPDQLFVARIADDGASDPTFGSEGVTKASSGDVEHFHAVALGPDGAIVTAGSRETGDGYDFFVARFLGDPPQEPTGEQPQEQPAPSSPPVVAPPVGSPPAGASPPPSSVPARACSNRISGTRRRDVLKGTVGPDRLKGGSGNDSLLGRAGDDCLYGGAGKDRLVGGPGVNKYSAGSGNDSVDARNGVKETVDCGAGSDRALVDPSDRVRGCERVTRRRAR